MRKYLGLFFILLAGLAIPFISMADDSDSWKTFVNDTGSGANIIDADEVNPMMTHMTGNWLPRKSTGARDTSEAYDLGSTSYAWRRIYTSNGTLETPAYSFKNASDTGLYLIRDHTIGISLDGTKEAEVGPVGILVGANASSADFPAAKLIASQADTTHTGTYNIGVLGEANASGAENGNGVVGIAKATGNLSAIGVTGHGKVNNTADTGQAIAGDFYSTNTHAGGQNIGIRSDARNGAVNYSFYSAYGTLYNVGDAQIDGTVTVAADKLALESKSIDIIQNSIYGIVDNATLSFTFPLTPAKIELSFSGELYHDTTSQAGLSTGHTVITITGTDTFTSVCNASHVMNYNGTFDASRTNGDSTNVIYIMGGHDGTDYATVLGTATWTTSTKTLLITFQESNSTTASNWLECIARAYK